MRREIEALLREARAAGELAAGDPAVLAETVVTIYNGALITWAIHREGTIEAWLRERLEAVLAPYTARTGESDARAPYATRRPVSSVE